MEFHPLDPASLLVDVAQGSATYVAGELARGHHAMRKAMERSPDLAATLLGLDKARAADAIADLA